MFVARNALRLAGGNTPTSLLFIKHAPFPGAATRRRLASGGFRVGWDGLDRSCMDGLDAMDVDKHKNTKNGPLVLLPPEILAMGWER